ncbi:MAG TPA: hypothetical protein VHE61_24295, partial [Opitutaceae bacterium]|nr:hypothetical protein [Opitutaceae bacterium]
MTTSSASPDSRAATWIAGALGVLPFLQVIPIDFDRTGALVLLLPALWAGRRHVLLALREIFGGAFAATAAPRGNALVAALVSVGGLATMIAALRADQPAPAFVTASEWVVLGAVALIAGRIARVDAAASRRMLLGLTVGAAAGMVAMWSWWLASGRGGVPMYAHYRHLGLHT